MQLQLNWIIGLQEVPHLATLMKAITFLGDEKFFLLLLPLIYLCIDARLGVRLGVLLLLCDSLCYYTKLLCHQPRPYWVDSRIHPLVTDSSYGLPSSHAQNGAAVWSFLALQSRRASGWVIALLVILLVSLSRIVLGVHFPTDILAGWVIGFLFLLLFLKMEPAVRRWYATHDIGLQIVATLAVSCFMVLRAIIIRDSIASSADPVAWSLFTDDPRSLGAIVGRAGALLGLGAGACLARRWARFRADGPLPQRLARLVLGLLGVAVCYFVLGAVFPGKDNDMGLALRFVRYALLTSWVTFGAPWLALRLKLAYPQTAETVA